MNSNTNNTKSLSRTIWAMLPWLGFFLLLLVIFQLGNDIKEKKEKLAAEKANAVQQEAPAINIIIQEIVPTTMQNSIELPAVTQAWHDLMIKSEVRGKVIKLAVKEGDVVQKGEAIAFVDSRDYQNAYDSIKAQHTLAKINFARLQKLQKKSAVSIAQFDQSQATLSELAAGLRDAALKLKRCTITAPFKGVVNSLPAEIGMLLDHADPVAQILDISRIKLDVAIPEADIAAVRSLNQASVSFAALADKTITGKKYYLASQPSSNAMTYTLQLKLPNDDAALLPGMFGRANIIKATHADTIGIPLYAIMHQDEQQYVFVIVDNVAERREVTTGFLQDWKVQITSGLSNGDHVAIVGHRSLENGQKVNIVKTVQEPGEVSL